ncbi:MAG: hypothetical protein DMC62_04390 [Verrucomicrobia bacterium]|nr:MAG: hypothetical protein DMC62_04390 [Verrucomicrobiota bacterium]
MILPHDLGTWRDAVAVKASELVIVPPELDPVQAAMLKINPMTAWRLLHDYVDLKSGDWLIQNAANSAAGRAVIQIARDLGYKTVDVVRREELIDELRAEGGDVVLVDGENLREEVKNATGNAPIHLGLNAVGGASALRLANTLAPGSTIVTFGAMSLQARKKSQQSHSASALQQLLLLASDPARTGTRAANIGLAQAEAYVLRVLANNYIGA